MGIEYILFINIFDYGTLSGSSSQEGPASVNHL